ncbi:MAG: endonuclease III [Gammaproteobacteria bacterium]|nr:endonuclease III [Gammaproteobacteria bacterium]NIR98155.1 endonuclease III [Gammaproteobacteria bacterium]NIT62542.1 endonuclease III [Gammaproteobacteria bacterium]NIV20799.1 endonuclease III [Gammaproteobacteria bacterium]NIY31122.1 endonuclease III [Gammaproteobacteria bacterium]
MADARKITRRLLKAYPDPRLELRFSNSLQLLIATILSAQCTDARVNDVTRELFKKYRAAGDFAEADRETLEQEIRPTGFYRNKAKTVINCCRTLVEEHGGRVPRSVDALARLPGVGRKTANMVRGNAFSQQAIAVDTHVLRVSNRLGLVDTGNADKAEQALIEQVPEQHWTAFSNAMILHGRRVCTAREPRCCDCPLYAECEWPDKLDCG